MLGKVKKFCKKVFHLDGQEQGQQPVVNNGPGIKIILNGEVTGYINPQDPRYLDFVNANNNTHEDDNTSISGDSSGD